MLNESAIESGDVKPGKKRNGRKKNKPWNSDIKSLVYKSGEAHCRWKTAGGLKIHYMMRVKMLKESLEEHKGKQKLLIKIIFIFK